MNSSKKNDLGILANQSPQTPFALNLYGKYFSTLDQTSEASRFFSEALKAAPHFCEPYNNLGQLMWKVGQQKEAFIFFSQALSKNPHLLIAQLNFFEAGLELEEYETTLNVIKYLEDEIPDCSEFLYYKAICKHKLGAADEAKSILKRILKKQPGDTEAQQLLDHYSL
ncbi:MAG: tetratricopeptide repeat protein [Deltaproteobacteria bacterium]|nr:MAG: tetratricopeptide repeat protein [Deltaproteobacteria bacterium]